MMMSNSKFVPDMPQQYQVQQQLEQQQFNLNTVASGKHYLSFGFESLPPITPPQYQEFNLNTQPTPKPRIWTQTDMFDNNTFMPSFQHIDQSQPQTKPLQYTPVLPTVPYATQDRDRSPLSPDDIVAEEAITKALASAEASAARPTQGKPPRRRRRKNSEIDPNGPQYPCDTCGKVFNKPYNLKSHLKTHSDEKPYLCQFCGKGFARGHDRKRHERLHDGSKKFRCLGTLKNGEKWGCEREFARADALGRHFRTENGWICIRPLMNEAKEMDINQLTDMISAQQK